MKAQKSPKNQKFTRFLALSLGIAVVGMFTNSAHATDYTKADTVFGALALVGLVGYCERNRLRFTRAAHVASR